MTEIIMTKIELTIRDQDTDNPQNAVIRNSKKTTAKKDRKIRDKLTEPKIDDMVDASFPASDPPSTY